jgi:hypothetical protein
MQKSMDCLLWLIEIVDDRFSIVKGACSKDIDIVVLAHVRQKLKAVGSNVESELISFVDMSHISFLVFVEY